MKKINYKLIGLRLKEARERKHISLEEAGQKVGVNKSTVLRWENGKTEKFKIPILEILADFYEVNPEWLMGHDVPMQNILNKNNIHRIPLISKYEISLQNSIEYNCLGYLSVNYAYDDLQNCFALQIQDDNSMAPLLDNDDIAIIHYQNNYDNGQTCLISLDNSTIIIRKILILSNNSIELHAMNPYYPVIVLQEDEIKNRNFKVIGKIIRAENNSAFK